MGDTIALLLQGTANGESPVEAEPSRAGKQTTAWSRDTGAASRQFHAFCWVWEEGRPTEARFVGVQRLEASSDVEQVPERNQEQALDRGHVDVRRGALRLAIQLVRVLLTAHCNARPRAQTAPIVKTLKH